MLVLDVLVAMLVLVVVIVVVKLDEVFARVIDVVAVLLVVAALVFNAVIELAVLAALVVALPSRAAPSRVTLPTTTTCSAAKLGSLRPLASTSCLAASTAGLDPSSSKMMEPERTSEHSTSRVPLNETTVVHSCRNTLFLLLITAMKLPDNTISTRALPPSPGRVADALVCMK